ncbi:energy transducer TonB [Thermomonas brevis]|uniref:Protein TonB n=1 Tax=Thermomonas brevis TaxID=215691 RepID=A0A7G9QPI3_9GAMM|nr:energy transducer TonB [Thermomonas brevis]QNN45258.1 energy transducer TonB [Thermomonas brevis]
MSASDKTRGGWAPLVLTVAVACALTACKKDDAAAAGQQAAQQAKPAPTPESVVAASVSAMSVDQLRDAANKAYNDNRLYAPAGDNAMEYYLALRDKQPGDAGASSALSDLLPMTVIATEQSIARDDIEEASRLLALIGKADGNHPALGRLKASIASGEAKLKQQADTQKLTAEEEAKRKADLVKQREEDQRKQQEQQRQQQAADQQRQQQAAADAEAERQRQAAAEQQRQQQAAEQQRQQQAAQQQAARPRPAAPSTELRPIAQPGPKYPAAAQRAGATATVQVEFTVGTDGAVSSARVVSSDGPRQFQREFEREALAAVKRWRFQPVGQATTSRRTIAFEQ